MLLGELRRAVGACQIVAQSKCKVTGRHHVARRWVDSIQSSGGDEKGGMSAILHEDAEHDRGIEILGAIQKDSTNKGNGFNKFGIKLEDRLSRFLLGPVLAEGDGMSNEDWVGVMKDGIGVAVAREELVPRANSMPRAIEAIRNGLVEVLRVVDRGKDSTIANNNLFSSEVWLVEALARKSSKWSGYEMDEVADRNDDVWILMVIVSFLHIRREKVVTKLICGHMNSWLSERSRQAGRSATGRRRKDGLLGHLGHHFFVGGEDQVDVIAIKTGMKMKALAHNDDFDDCLVSTKSFLEGLLDIRLSAESNSLSGILGKELVIELVHDGGNASWLAVAKMEKLGDFSVDYVKEIRVEDNAAFIEEIIIVMSVVRGARFQQ
jgi:hypothetical protein